jgi:hypothetical protein
MQCGLRRNFPWNGALALPSPAPLGHSGIGHLDFSILVFVPWLLSRPKNSCHTRQQWPPNSIPTNESPSSRRAQHRPGRPPAGSIVWGRLLFRILVSAIRTPYSVLPRSGQKRPLFVFQGLAVPSPKHQNTKTPKHRTRPSSHAEPIQSRKNINCATQSSLLLIALHNHGFETHKTIARRADIPIPNSYPYSSKTKDIAS